MTRASRLRELLRSDSILVAPGAYDAWSARLVEQAGFASVYMTGFGAAASCLGMPDLGLMTATEMGSQAKRLSDAIRVPLIADADNGFGDVLNVQRTVRDYERAGVAAIQLEDQVSPKKCGHMENKQLVDTSQMVRNVKAALAAREDADTVIIARTDARSVNGLDDAYRRADAYASAGADVIFVESPLSDEELVGICKRFAGLRLMANMAPGCKTPYHTAAELGDMGFSLVIYPIDTLLAATSAMVRSLEHLRTHGKTPDELVDVDWGRFNQLMDLPRYVETASTFAKIGVDSLPSRS
jgi:2-methylisocitrate lyase-like PEP mutase family enzyme